MQQTAPQSQKKVLPALAAPVFPAGTATAQLLSSIGRIEKQPEARKPILSKDARVVYLATKEEGMTMLQAIEEANARGLTLIPHADIDERLNGEAKIWKVEEEFYPCWTGTFVAYCKANTPLGKTIEYLTEDMTYVFKVPKKAQRRINVALAINHGFTEDGTPLISFKPLGENKFLVEIADESKIKIVEDFPTKDGWFLPENKFGIPINIPACIEMEKEARKLSKTTYAYAGLLARLGIDFRHDILAFHGYSMSFGVLAYAKQQQQTEEIQK